MKRRDVIVTLAALLAIGVASFWAYRHEQRRETAGMCPFCDRMVHSVTAYRIKVGNHVVVACCPRCGMRAPMNQERRRDGMAWATDVSTGERVAAESAVYVEGGDVQYCTHGDQPVMREPHGASPREYDRCLPTLVAFKSAQEAKAYQEHHGGRVLSYSQALASVREQ
jgi:NMD protein affecting ribosome stability and mRNA decay